MASETQPYLSVGRCRLTVVDGPDAGLTWTSTDRCTIVGKSEKANLVLSDSAVSRFHCEISFEKNTARIRDLESRNGTRVDNVWIDRARLTGGHTLTLGRTRIRFDLDTERNRIELSERERFGELVGSAPTMRAMFAVLERAAATDATVLLEGETGTGKEAAAESIHRASKRKDGPFVVVDCGSLPPNLIESELFGHEKGAFTGAVTRRDGAFKEAHEGTIFLDEIGELSLDLQPKLLRALEGLQVKRLGSRVYEKIDVRVIAATNRNLRAEVNAGRFRSDLYYRLAVIEARLPPLRERTEDLPRLIDDLLTRLGAADEPEAVHLRSDELVAHLTRHPWHGNVRELRNYLERCLAMGQEVALPASPDGLSDGDGFRSDLPLKEARKLWDRAPERRYLEEVLRRADGNVSQAARLARVDRTHFHRLLRKHGLR